MAASPELQAAIGKLLAPYDNAARAVHAPSVEGIRQMARNAVFIAPVPAGVSTIKVLAETVPCEWVCAEGADPNKRLMYLHGGGYVAGDLDTHRALCGDISVASGASVLNVNYRRTPEYSAPAQYDDAMMAYSWMLDHGPTGGGSASHIFVAGDSAGGGLALSVLQGIRDVGCRQPTAAVAISPWTDVTLSAASIVSNADKDPLANTVVLKWLADLVAADGFDRKDPRISPVFGVFDSLPPFLIQVAEDEVLLDDSRTVAALAKQAGVDVTLECWPHVTHVWHAMGRAVPEASKAIDRVGEYLRSFH